ncbi:hypothetical protein SAMN04488092_11696 [Thalassovita taeanensis]|uniref:Uncharacterized protein n=1 Tax=Thalassovita taeanensis TaxID=657014 RepID=A0A1H9JZP7_9RHOB|nr:hypothetical protein SAMN04488092_11696 [Thalassovita taeanensis]
MVDCRGSQLLQVQTQNFDPKGGHFTLWGRVPKQASASTPPLSPGRQATLRGLSDARASWRYPASRKVQIGRPWRPGLAFTAMLSR